MFELLPGLAGKFEGCGPGICTASVEGRRSDDPRFGGGLPAVWDDASVFLFQILFKRRYAGAERAWTHRWKREVEAVVVVAAVHGSGSEWGST